MPQSMKIALGWLLTSLVLTGSMVCAAATSVDVPIEFATAESVLVLQQTDQPLLIVDVRDRQAFEALHIRGAVNIPLANLERRYPEIPQQRPVVLY